jgi:catechol 2,3-dioxygenase-like lactoylglutathione lyase family enzyme
MRVLGYTWAGVRSTDLESTVRFFAETLGLSLIEQHEGLAQFVMPSGQLFEVFGSKSRYYQLHACPVLGFQVEDVRAATEGVGISGRGVRDRCVWRRIRTLDVFSRS